jgi:hypothetical protein
MKTQRRGHGQKKSLRSFEKRISKDALSLKHRDGKTIKLECVERTQLSPAEVNGPGSESMELEFSAYEKRIIEFLAAPNSFLTLINPGALPLHQGGWFAMVR